MPDIPRIVKEQKSNEFAKMAIMILALPRVRTNAVAIFPGMGEMWRLQHAVQVFKESKCGYFLAAGSEWKTEKTESQPTVGLLRGHPNYFPDYDLDRVHIQEHARHTADQAEWVVAMIGQLKIQSLSLVVSPYHLPRAYLTLLKALLTQGRRRIPIIPVPVPMNPSTTIPESGGDSWSMVDGEAQRTEKYQSEEFKNVATLDELKSYLNWLWRQPMLHN